MIDWTKYDLSRAELRYAVANSPMFLMEGLKADAEVMRLSKAESWEDLIAELKIALSDMNSSISSVVRAYVIIVAGSLKGGHVMISELARMASEYGGWLETLASTAREAMLTPSFRTIEFAQAAKFKSGTFRQLSIPTENNSNISTKVITNAVKVH